MLRSLESPCLALNGRCYPHGLGLAAADRAAAAEALRGLQHGAAGCPPPGALAPPVVRIKLSWLASSGWLRPGRSTAELAAWRFLFGRHRLWIRKLAACVMARDGLRPREFVSLFVRESIEKRAELKAHGHGSVPTDAYARVAARAMAAAMAAWT